MAEKTPVCDYRLSDFLKGAENAIGTIIQSLLNPLVGEAKEKGLLSKERGNNICMLASSSTEMVYCAYPFNTHNDCPLVKQLMK